MPDLAGTVAVSRSLLDARFRARLGRSPIRYLADWRGYDSEEAFSRAFKRARGTAPSAWRGRRLPAAVVG